MSPYDKTMDKLDFYAAIGVRELLVVDRDTKEIELFALHGNKMESRGQSIADGAIAVASKVLPLSFQLRDGEDPQILVRRTDAKNAEWLI
jgi:hypothetical protein